MDTTIIDTIRKDTAVKADEDKARFDLIPADALYRVAYVFTHGAKKYKPHNWEKGLEWSRIYAAAQRHLNSFWIGYDVDVESGLHALAHAAADVLMLLHYVLAERGTDDRTFALEDSTND